MDGTYGFVYAGIRGVGIGIFQIKNGILKGTDYCGVQYTGTVTAIDGGAKVHLSINASVPAGVCLVQGTSEQDIPYMLSADQELPANFAHGLPITIQQGQGPVTLMISRITDDFASHISGFRLVPAV